MKLFKYTYHVQPIPFHINLRLTLIHFQVKVHVQLHLNIHVQMDFISIYMSMILFKPLSKSIFMFLFVFLRFIHLQIHVNSIKSQYTNTLSSDVFLNLIPDTNYWYTNKMRETAYNQTNNFVLKEN